MLKTLHRLWTEKTGLAGVEFAFTAPVMIAFLFGLIEAGQALAARSDVNGMASIGSDLIAQESSVTTADMTNVFNALGAMLYPYSTTAAQITISSVIDSGTPGTGKVAWSCTLGGTARPKNQLVTLPNTTIVATGGSVIFTEVRYNYTSLVGSYFMTPMTWNNTFYSKPRRVLQVPLVACP